MTITEVTTIPGQTGGKDQKGRSEYTVPYRVVTDGTNNNMSAVLSAAGLPQPHTFFPADPLAYYDGATARQEARDRNRWIVDVKYRQPDNQEDEDEQQNPDPIIDRVEYWLESELFEEIVEEDRNGDPIENPAGDPYDTPIVDEAYRLVLVAEKNFADFQQIIDLNLNYVDKVNSAAYRGGAARSWLCRPIQCSRPKYRGQIQYYTAQFRLAYNPNLWNRKIRSTGFRYVYSGAVATNNAKYKIATDEFGRRHSTPVDLTSTGGLMAQDQNPHYKTYEIKDEIAFSGLGI